MTSYLTISAQQQPLETAELSSFTNATPTHCAERTAALDGITQSTLPNDSIIVIAHLGDGDIRPNLNWRRLHNVRMYWTQYLPGEARRRPETIILAEGERIRGYGHLEFYVGGRLVWVMKVARNADLSLGTCYLPDESYIRNRVFNPCWLESNRIFIHAATGM